jgi:hypothetical protein
VAAAAISFVQQVVRLDALALASRHLDERPRLVFLRDGVAKLQRAARRECHLLVAEVHIAVRSFDVTHAAQGGHHVVLRVGLRRVDHVVDRIRLGEDGVRGIVGLRVARAGPAGADRAPADLDRVRVGRILVELLVVEILARQQTKLPQMVSDILADVRHRAVRAHDDLRLFVRAGVGIARSCTNGDAVSSCATHHPAAGILARGLLVQHAALDHHLAGHIPEVQRENLTFAWQEVVFDTQPLHGFKMPAQYAGRDQLGNFRRLVASGFELVQCLQTHLPAPCQFFRRLARFCIPLRDARI